MNKRVDAAMLQMALLGYEAERQKIQEKIAEIQTQLGGHTRSARGPVATHATKRTRRMSAAARRRIAAAQRKRWADYHRKQKAA